MQLFLTGTIGDQSKTWPIEGDALRIGRSSRNPIHLPDGTVSKEHAELRRRDGRWWIRDLGSRNGTRVSGADAREELPIAAGDRIEIGHVMLQVTDDSTSQRVRFNDATVLGSSLKIRADEMLDRRTPVGVRAVDTVKLLAEAGRLLVLPRPLQETCDELLAFVEKAIHASRYVMILQAGRDAEPQQMAARTVRGRADEPLALSRSIMRLVMDDCTSVITGDAASDPRFQGNMSIVAQAVHSAMAVPLFDNERVLGLIYVDSSDVRVSFGEEQLELLTLLANMAAVKITNARLLETEQARLRMAQELATASRIQRGLLLAEPPAVAGWQIDAFLESCYEVGGDLYDFYVRPDGKLVILAGDVTGKGMGAALLMSSFLATARVLYDTCDSMGELATRLNAILHRSTDAVHFVTGFVGCLDPASGVMRYVNAGHPAPLLTCDGVVRSLDSTGVPFGVLPSFPYGEAEVAFAPGETLALFSDGIPEAQHGDEFFDDARLEALFATSRSEAPAELRARILEGVLAFVGDEPRADDITLVLIRRERSA